MTPSLSIAHRPNLSQDLATLLREMIFDGRLAAGSRINEVHFAASLGVSRTPLREALATLGTEGALLNLPRRGYVVRQLTAEEAREIYPIRSLLDPEALRLSGIPGAAQFKTLDALCGQLERATIVQSAIRYDDDWHRTVWANCPNSVLIDLIEQFMRRTRRYELASMSDARILRMSASSKREIADLLKRDDMRGACRRLRKSLEGGVIPVLEWLESRDEAG